MYYVGNHVQHYNFVLKGEKQAIYSSYTMISKNKFFINDYMKKETVFHIPHDTLIICVLKAHFPTKIDMGYRGRRIGTFKKSN